MTGQASGSHLVIMCVRADRPVRRTVVRRVRLYLVLCVGGDRADRGRRMRRQISPFLATFVDVFRRPHKAVDARSSMQFNLVEI